MNQEELLQVESSQRQHHEVLEHQCRMGAAVQADELQMFSMLKPKLVQDGNQWCVLYGADLQSGIAGFGDTPYTAIIDWNGAFQRKAERPPKSKNIIEENPNSTALPKQQIKAVICPLCGSRANRVENNWFECESVPHCCWVAKLTAI